MKGKNKPKPAYVKTLTDQQWAHSSLAERAAHVARSQLRNNVQEFPRGSNWGPQVSIYLRVAGWNSPQPWCAAFVFWCLIQAGADRKKLWRNAASTWSLYQWAVNYRSEGFKRGLLFDEAERRRTIGVFSNGKQGHTWFCMDNITYRTIEGNTNDGGSREGFKVAERVRTPESLEDHNYKGFIVIPDDLYEVSHE